MHLGEVVEAAGLLREQHAVLAALVLDLEPALLDVDVRLAVLAHRAELDDVDVAVDLADRVHHVEGADDVVGLRVDRVAAVDHGVRRGALLGEVDHRVGGELAEGVVDELGVAQVAGVARELGAADLAPGLHPRAHRLDRHQAARPELVVVLTANAVVEDSDVMSASRQVHRGGPAEVAVSTQDQDSHCFLSHRRTARGAFRANARGRNVGQVSRSISAPLPDLDPPVGVSRWVVRFGSGSGSRSWSATAGTRRHG